MSQIQKRAEEIRRVYKTTLVVLAIVAATVYLLLDIRYALVIVFLASPSLFSLRFYLRRLEREEVVERPAQESPAE